MNLNKKLVMDVVKLRAIRAFFRGFKAPLYIHKETREKLKKYKDKYKGKRCFIVGNGPSLCPEDLELIKNEYTFAANRIFKIFDKTSWRPTFYCIQDNYVAVQMKDEVFQAIDVAQECFFRMYGYRYTKELYESRKNIVYVPIVEEIGYNNKVKFSDRADRYLHDGETVTYLAMQMAAYMGFSEIYLLGVDHRFPFERKKNGDVIAVDKSLSAHFYENPNNNEGENAYKWRTSFKEQVTRAYESARAFAEKTKKFTIYNATRGGELEVFERVTLEDVLNG